MLESISSVKHQAQTRLLKDGRLLVHQVVSFAIVLDAQELMKLPYDSPIFANTVRREISLGQSSILVSWKPASRSLLVTLEMVNLLSSPHLETGPSISLLENMVRRELEQGSENGEDQSSPVQLHLDSNT